MQTPQVFKSNVIRLAYEQEYQSFFTDDASVVQACGQDIALVNGNEENIKITITF
ncbi:MAG: 2-C-methyl-D-erythritol 4-phosphate cytidylyltransferase [Crocinitomicaceae bacterium]